MQVIRNIIGNIHWIVPNCLMESRSKNNPNVPPDTMNRVTFYNYYLVYWKIFTHCIGTRIPGVQLSCIVLEVKFNFLQHLQ